MNSIEAAKTFKNAVDEAVININDRANEVIDSIVLKFEKKITERIDKVRGEQLDIDDARDELDRLERFAKKLEPDFEAELDDLIRENLINTGNALLEEYKKKLASLTESVGNGHFSVIAIDPLKLMGGSVAYDDFLIQRLAKSKEVEDGEEWVENTNKKWYKPWTWFQEKGYYRTKYKTVQYVNASELAQEFLTPAKEMIYDDGDNAKNYALKQSNHIAAIFRGEFKRLDEILRSKLAELESYASDKEKAEERIRESEKKLEWLNNIKSEVESILEI